MDPKKLMGYETPGDKKVPISAREWHAMKLALWRSRSLSEIVIREASEIIDRCKHSEECPGAQEESEPCLASTVEYTGNSEVITDGCPDREQRMSALVILNAARQLSPADARKPSAEPYFAPSREYFSEVLAEFATMQIENDMLRAKLREAGVPEPARNSTEGVLRESHEAAQLASPEEEAT